MAARKVAKKITPVEEPPVVVSETTSSRPNKLIIIVLALVVLGLLLWKFKTLFVVAIVNGRPVTRYELEQKIMSRYGKQTLDEIVSERLVIEKAQQDKVTVTATDIDTKIADLTKMLAGQTSLDQALAQQGMTMEEFRHQVYLQSLVEKIAEPQVKIEDKDISDYITQNKSYLTATDEAGMKNEAITALKRQKVSEVFGTIFSDLKSKAKVINLLTLQTPF